MSAPGRRRPLLGASPLEPRLAPAGVVTASLAGGLLTLTGDDAANNVTLKVTGTAVTLTPDSSTAIDDLGKAGPGTPGAAVTITGTASALAADLKGGADFLLADDAADLVLPGGVTARLGDGANHLRLITNGKIDLGRLVVTAGDGLDFVDVSGGTGLGNRVTGVASFNLGAGQSNTSLIDIALPGPNGLRVTDGPSGSHSILTGANISIAGTVRATFGGASGVANITDGTLGGIAVAGLAAAIDLDGVKIGGGVSVRARGDAQFGGPGAADILGPVSVIGGRSASVHSFGPLTAGSVTVRAGTTASLDGGVGFTAAAVSVTGTQQAEVDATAGTFAADSLTIRTAGPATLKANGAALKVAGNLTVSSGLQTFVSINTAAESDVGGNVTVTGGPGVNKFIANAPFKFGKSVAISLGNGQDTVTIGTETPAVPIPGSLTIRTGAGDDQVDLDGITVGGPTRITTGAGADSYQVDSTTFTGPVLVDLGSGDDAISIAQFKLRPAPVTFLGTATIRAGTGDDTLILGNTSGDANTKAVFQAGGTIDGGTGLNLFDGLTPLEPPAVFTGLSAGNFLHWTDPHP